jgi:hypothetical protein
MTHGADHLGGIHQPGRPGRVAQQAADFTRIGGRCDYLGGRPAASIVYKRRVPEPLEKWRSLRWFSSYADERFLKVARSAVLSADQEVLW